MNLIKIENKLLSAGMRDAVAVTFGMGLGIGFTKIMFGLPFGEWWVHFVIAFVAGVWFFAMEFKRIDARNRADKEATRKGNSAYALGLLHGERAGFRAGYHFGYRHAVDGRPFNPEPPQPKYVN